MLNQFKSDTRGTLGEYIIDNYKATGYRIVTIATEFPGQKAPNWGGGTGFWQVDYPVTSSTFWNLMVKYTPIAVMTTSRNTDDKIWLLEIGSTNLPQKSWALLAWNAGRPPYIGGSNNDPAAAAGLPNAGIKPKDGNPPDATRNQNTQLNGIAGVVGKENSLQITIINDLKNNIPPADLTPQQNKVVQGPPNDIYVSAYAGYHAVWYSIWSKTCKAGWHTHVGAQITVATATTAIQRQLAQLIAWLNKQ